MDIGWISLHRKLLSNPIVCKDSDYIAVWIYLLLNATHAEYDTIFKGNRTTLKAGQLITGREVISKLFKINSSKVQRILKKLESEQQIEQQTSNVNRLITIINWLEYQQSEQQNEQRVNNKRTTSEQRVNTYNNDNNVNNENNDTFNFKKSFLDLGVEQVTLEDWLKVRTKKRASNTETAFNGLKTKIEKSGLSANECIKLAAENSWSGFNIDWVKNLKGDNNQKQNLRTSEGLNENYSSGI